MVVVRVPRGTTTSDEQRWQQALQRAGEVRALPPVDVGQERRRSDVRWAVLVLVAAAAVAMVVHRVAGGAPLSSALLTSEVRHRVQLGALVVTATGLLRQWLDVRRTGGWLVSSSAPSSLLSWSQRRALWRQVRGQAPVSEEHLPVLLDAARREVFGTGQTITGVGLFVFFSCDLEPSVLWGGFAAVGLAAVVTWGVVRSAGTGRAALRFLGERSAARG